MKALRGAWLDLFRPMEQHSHPVPTALAMGKDVVIRLTAFLSVLLVMALWEAWAPRRNLTTPRGRRWAANLSIVVLDAVTIRLLFAAGAVGAAIVAVDRGWGLLNQRVNTLRPFDQ
jgi:hypothetical protein